MPPRHLTLPSAQTASAREAQKSFYCQLCSKGYSRMNDYEAHLSSYDHSHKQRLKDMKAMVRDPTAGSRARKAEAKADGLISIKLPGQETATGGGGFKKGGFKKSGFKSAFTKVEGSGSAATTTEKPKPASTLEPAPVNPGLQKNLSPESDTEDEGYEVYDPQFPTN
ncbi:G patch domain-containing protein [Fusarium bulbicola]|nr:c2h2 type zinc finger containing protein [Fusarium mexicanum]KAF5657859.1 c2h2 type zinc finger containing protein [Fusarium circinatum]KAF5966789.1 G patch domain-containing protein [Fusarium bulbicola]